MSKDGGKYEPLGAYLRKQRAAHVPMTFAEIERIIGSKLPKSQQYPAWWSNSTTNNVMTQVWLDAGFQSEQVDTEEGKLVFRRVAPLQEKKNGGDTKGEPKTRHPLIGWLKGTVTIAPGVDLTEPVDPRWSEMAYGAAAEDGDR